MIRGCRTDGYLASAVYRFCFVATLGEDKDPRMITFLLGPLFFNTMFRCFFYISTHPVYHIISSLKCWFLLFAYHLPRIIFN